MIRARKIPIIKGLPVIRIDKMKRNVPKNSPIRGRNGTESFDILIGSCFKIDTFGPIKSMHTNVSKAYS